MSYVTVTVIADPLVCEDVARQRSEMEKKHASGKTDYHQRCLWSVLSRITGALWSRQ